MRVLLKKIYEFLPFKKFIYLFLKRFFKIPHSIYKHLHFKGIFKVKVKKNIFFKIHHFGFEVENEIFWNGLENGWEKESINIWKELCACSNVIFDIGANTGVFTLIAKAINPSSRVFAYEPVERVFEKLKQNVTLNNYSVTYCKKAVSNFNGTAIIYDLPTEHIYSVTVNKNNFHSEELRKMSKEVEIETIKLSTIIKENNLNNIDLMKIDVETHEVEVLEGMETFLEKFRPTLLIEVLNNEVATGLNNILKNIDYLYFNINEVSGIKQVKEITKSDSFNFLICKQEIALKLKLI